MLGNLGTVPGISDHLLVGYVLSLVMDQDL
jgi:hypothetical protein